MLARAQYDPIHAEAFDPIGLHLFPPLSQQLRRWVGLNPFSDAVHGEPTIDDQLGAGNVFGLVRREEESRVRDIPRIAHTSHRALPVSPADHFIGTATVSGNDPGAWTIG